MMKRWLSTLALLTAALLCSGATIVVSGPVKHGGGGPIIETIVGTNDAGAVATNPLPAGAAQGSTSIATGTWTGPAATAVATTCYAKFSEWDGDSNYKFLVYNSSNALIGTSAARSITTGQYGAFQSFNMSGGTAPTITEGQTYGLFVIAETGQQKIYVSTGGNGHAYSTTGTYASPATTYAETDNVQATVHISAYCEGDTQ